MKAMILSLLMTPASAKSSERQFKPASYGLFSIALLVITSVARPVFAADELCKQVKSFEQTPLTKLPDGELQRRWMDFSWGPDDELKPNEVRIGVTLRCSGSDDAAKALCQYAVHNSPHETITALPRGILRCFGFISNKAAYPRRWVEDLRWDAPNDLIERFEIDQYDRPDHVPAMRLTLMPYPESPQGKKPEPFFKGLSAKLDPSDEDRD